MNDPIKEYRKTVEQPWGRMFYDQLYAQLDIPNDKKLKILDFGAGFCLTASHYAERHDVTALEPNEEMLRLRVKSDSYTLIAQGAEYLQNVGDDTFDAVFCHNVLEYADNREYILPQLARVLKPNGILSVVKHNLLGRVMAFAVYGNDPGKALGLLNGECTESSGFGDRNIYPNEFPINALSGEMTLIKTYGIRTFFGLSSNNEIKSTDEWYSSMLKLETAAGTIEEYKKIAFFNHLIFKKRTKERKIE